MKLIIENNKTKLIGETKQILKLRNHPSFAVRVPGAFFSPAFRKRQWDGYVRFISEGGILDTGKLPEFIRVMKELYPKEKLIADDRRFQIKRQIIPALLGGMPLRPNQTEVLKTLAFNTLKFDNTEINFPRGIAELATNFGKTLTSAAIADMYNKPTLFILSSKDLLLQALEDIPKLLPGKVGVIASGHKLVWKPFMIVMVKSAKNYMSEIEKEFSKYPVVIVDECDLATSKTYKSVLNHTYNSFVRIGMSGSAFDPRKKERNERLKATFGDSLIKVTNREQIDQGYSSPVKVYMWEGNSDVRVEKGFNDEYTFGIVKNAVRNKRIINRVVDHVRNRKRKPILIICKLHKHVEILFKRASKHPQLKKYSIDWVHHERKDRQQVIKRFENNKLDILVGSYILKRGKNFPWMKAILAVGGGDSMSIPLQILGRATRKHKSKDEVIFDDFFDKGKYLLRHSKHRLKVYKDEKIEVYERFKKEKKKVKK